MFEKMDISSRLNDFGGFPVPAQPPADDRAHRRGARARRHRRRPGAASVLEHTVAQARARVLMDTRVDALRRWQARDADRDGHAPPTSCAP